MTAAALLLRPEQLDEDLRLAAGQLVHRIAQRRQVDQPQSVEAVRLRPDRAGANAAQAPLKLPRPAWRRQRVRRQAGAERAFHTAPAELELDLDLPWRGRPQRGHRRRRQLREPLRVREVQRARDRGLARAVRPEQHREPPRQRARQLVVRSGAEPAHRHLAQKHGAPMTPGAPLSRAGATALLLRARAGNLPRRRVPPSVAARRRRRRARRTGPFGISSSGSVPAEIPHLPDGCGVADLAVGEAEIRTIDPMALALCGTPRAGRPDRKGVVRAAPRRLLLRGGH